MEGPKRHKIRYVIIIILGRSLQSIAANDGDTEDYYDPLTERLLEADAMIAGLGAYSGWTEAEKSVWTACEDIVNAFSDGYPSTGTIDTLSDSLYGALSSL